MSEPLLERVIRLEAAFDRRDRWSAWLFDIVPVSVFSLVTVGLLVMMINAVGRLGAVEARLDGIDNRLGRLEDRLGRLEERLDRSNELLVEIARTLGRIEGGRPGAQP